MAFHKKKSLGQNFLKNKKIPKIIADAGDVCANDVIIEVGPGTGALTVELLLRGANVIAIEADLRAIKVLKEKFSTEIGAGKLKLIHADIKTFDISSLNLKPRSFKVVANIPYYLSGFLFRFFLETKNQPSELVFLVQKEVAHRIARDKKESLLSLSIKVYGDPKYVKTIKKRNFTPQPKVDSAILSIKDIGLSRFGSINPEFFFSIIHEGFKSKRKQLLGNLSKMYERDVLTHIFSTLNLQLDVRAEDVPLDLWLKICRSLPEQP